MNKKLKISIISMNLSTNCTNRCLLLAKALQSDYDVEILGTTFGVGRNWGKGLWPPLEDIELQIIHVPGDYFPKYLFSIVCLIKKINGDVVIACKPRFPSYGIALINRLLKGTPVILDVDDDELAQTLPGKKAKIHNFIRSPNGYWTTRLMHLFRKSADSTLCVSRHFQKIYGGVIVPHGRDCNDLRPNMFNREQVLTELSIDASKKVLGFIGTPQASKGIDLTLKSIKRLKREDMVFLLVSADKSDPYILSLLKEYSEILIVIEPQSLQKIPYFYSAIDIVVLAQENTRVNFGQMPAKLTDAMAMAKPIIASNISDIPYYLEDCGLIVEPGNINELIHAIEWMIDNFDQAIQLGIRARKVFEEKMTTESMLLTIRMEINKLFKLN